MDGGLKGIQQSYRVNKRYNGNMRKGFATLCNNWRYQDCLAAVMGFESGFVSPNTKSATFEYAPRRKTVLTRLLRSFSSKHVPGFGSSWDVWPAFFINAFRPVTHSVCTAAKCIRAWQYSGAHLHNQLKFGPIKRVIPWIYTALPRAEQTQLQSYKLIKATFLGHQVSSA